MKKAFLNVVITSLALPLAGEIIASTDKIQIEEIIVLGEEALPTFPRPEPIAVSQTDSASLLKSVPGANINSNGPITGIAQYRGLFGDRVAVSMDNDAVLSGGPNAMDAPLSYAPPLLLKSLKVTPGIASVSASQEAIGGHIVATLDRGEFANAEDTETSGAISSRYGTLDDGVNHGLKAVVANDQHKLAALASYDEGNDGESGNGDKLADTGYRRERYDLSYAWQNDTSNITLSGGKLDTNDTGTPALPMDIVYIHTDIANLSAATDYKGMTFRTRVGYSDVDHLMDNFSLRSNANPMMYRQNNATGRQFSWGGSVELPLGEDTLTMGIDGTKVVHDALITNPNMAMFAVQNFSDAERDIYGLFAEWKHNTQQWQIETGLRYNRVNMDSDEVSASGMMPMMQNLADGLAGGFNGAERDQSFDNIDIVIKASRPLTDTTGLNIGIARKTRAPSYQELYLWLPLESTGGLADGRSYIGNLDLDSEVNYEINTGLDWQAGNVYASAQVFFRKVDDFIQGTPSNNMSANMLATMMSGQAPLQFNNIDAELYGFDGRYGLILNDNWRLDGVLSYVRGEDKDNSDNLYRIAPLNHSLAVSWQKAALSARLESVLYAKQSKTSNYNDEQDSAGYGLLNVQGQYRISQQFKISAGIDNLLDKHYVDHLSGYNRNSDSDIALGDRLPGRGRNLFIAMNISW
ncbi:MAG: TonB-dependent receptor [Porticoccaceae bacterium]|nr:TonB-dependent receptor [Porticoccaceae bacterium]